MNFLSRKKFSVFCSFCGRSTKVKSLPRRKDELLSVRCKCGKLNIYSYTEPTKIITQ